jgi:BolA family transcriptional regulator, general stress-responsive regulator
MTDVRERIETILKARLKPAHLEIRDDSARHAGHAGAASGGGHFDVVIVAAAFEGKPLLERHRMVNEALRDMIGREIHALGLRTIAPSEAPRTPQAP